MLTEELIKDFQQAFKADYGLDLSLEETEVLATALVKYFRILSNVAEQELQKNKI